MANDIISAFLSKPTLTITDQTTSQATAKNLKVSSVQIRFSSEVFRHQLEDGSTYVDGRVLKPIRVDFDVICPDVNTLNQVNEIMGNRETMYKIKTRGVIIGNLLVDSDTIKQSGEMLSATPIKLSMKELMLDSVNPVIYNNPANNSLIDRGVALVNEAETTVTGLFATATGLLQQAIGG